jgi:retron-type reverse transcriptase
MERNGKLYDAICDIENIHLAHKKAKRGKRHYTEVRMVDGAPDVYLGNIQKMLVLQTFKNSPYKVFSRVEKGKLREIYKLPYYPDRIIHHAVMNILEPIWAKVFIRDTYSSIKGRGIHDGVRRMKKFLKDTAGTAYCLKMDVRKFYPSIDHGTLKSVIRKSIKCRRTLWLLDAVIDSAPGVPIGNYLSQYFANLYLAYLDHWAKETLRIKYYTRYCDDIVVLHHDKTRLHEWRVEIDRYLRDKLQLDLKANWQVFPTQTRGIDFLGYRFFGEYTLIRKRIAAEFKRKVAMVCKGKVKTYNQVVCPIMSYHGWLKHGNGRHLWRSQITDEIKVAADAACSQTGTTNPTRRIA